MKRALEELEEKGLIALTRRGQFLGRRASQYRLTAQRHRGHPPTRDWERWKPGSPTNSDRGPEVARIGSVTVPFENRDGKFCAV